MHPTQLVEDLETTSIKPQDPASSESVYEGTIVQVQIQLSYYK